MGVAPPPLRGRRRRARTTTSRPPSWSLRTQHPGAWALRTLTGPRASPGGCAHWPRPPAPWQGLLRVDLPPGEPTVLELGTTRAVDPAEAEAWLRDPQRLSVAGCCDAVYLRKTTPGWVLRKVLESPGKCCWSPMRCGRWDPKTHPRSRTCTGGSCAFWSPLLRGRTRSWSLRTQPCRRGDSPSSLLPPGPRRGRGRGPPPPPHRGARPPPPTGGSPAPPSPGAAGPVGGAWLPWEPRPWGSWPASSPSAEGPRTEGPRPKWPPSSWLPPPHDSQGSHRPRIGGAGAWGRRMGSCVGTEDRDRLCLRGRDPKACKRERGSPPPNATEPGTRRPG